MKAATVLAIIAAVVFVTDLFWPLDQISITREPIAQQDPEMDAREAELGRVYEAIVSEWDRLLAATPSEARQAIQQCVDDYHEPARLRYTEGIVTDAYLAPFPVSVHEVLRETARFEVDNDLLRSPETWTPSRTAALDAMAHCGELVAAGKLGR